jgi:release factor glutamine methyltransferase
VSRQPVLDEGRIPATGRHAPRIAPLLAAATERLAGAGCDTPRLDAELLLAEALGADRATLLTRPDAAVAPGAAGRFEALLTRRADREPVAYVLGRRGFRHVELHVDRRVLIPRPETELLVEAALALPRGAGVHDVGTGSGAVALALKHERPDLEVTGSDISPDAVDVARANAARLGLAVDFWVADLLDGAPEHDALLANLPYVADRDHESLSPEITRYEPAAALFAGPDGLGAIRRLVGRAGGARFLALEVGAGQAGRVRELMAAGGWPVIDIRADLAGVERVVVGRR